MFHGSGSVDGYATFKLLMALVAGLFFLDKTVAAATWAVAVSIKSQIKFRAKSVRHQEATQAASHNKQKHNSVPSGTPWCYQEFLSWAAFHARKKREALITQLNMWFSTDPLCLTNWESVTATFYLTLCLLYMSLGYSWYNVVLVWKMLFLSRCLLCMHSA